MPKTAKLKITEEKNGRGMRWDYEFGVPGEPGHDFDTKRFVMKPSKERMSTAWKGRDEVFFDTIGLEAFAQNGFGRFSSVEENDSRISNPQSLRVTMIMELHPSSLTYLWVEGSDSKSLRASSRFKFTRDQPISSN